MGMMRNFLKIGEIDPIPLLQQVMTQPELWNAKTTRTYHPQSALRNIDDILLRYNAFNEGDDFVEKVCSEIENVNMPAFNVLPAAQNIVFGLMTRMAGERLGRVFISRMAPGCIIPPHTDRIIQAEEAFPNKVPPAVYYSRYQVALKASPGVEFRVGDEQVYMAPGSIWYFNNLIEHSVINNSNDDRISMVVDIRSFSPC
jgi:Aspartyl/Asparaginyl beta-hydroxylase